MLMERLVNRILYMTGMEPERCYPSLDTFSLTVWKNVINIAMHVQSTHGNPQQPFSFVVRGGKTVPDITICVKKVSYV